MATLDTRAGVDEHEGNFDLMVSKTVSRSTLILLAIVAGVSVANNYYIQPLLYVLATSFHQSTKTIGILVTLSQFGYVVGLITIVPLGDRISRRFLLGTGLLLSVAFCLLQSQTRSFPIFAASVLFTGVTSTVAQTSVAFSAAISDPDKRASSVSVVIAGLLTGILLARTAAGLIAQLFGYRAVFLSAAIASAALVIIIFALIPGEGTKAKIPYLSLLSSVLTFFVSSPLLRRRALFGGITFACFSIFWTTLAPYLSAPPFHLNLISIGLIGFAGLAGVFAARLAGFAADRGFGHIVTPVGWLILIGSFSALVIGRRNILVIVAFAAILDLGIQGIHITNQSIIYRLDPLSQSRVTTAYMTSYFTGGVLGSAGATLAFARFGIVGSYLFGVVITVFGLLVWALGRSREKLMIQELN